MHNKIFKKNKEMLFFVLGLVTALGLFTAYSYYMDYRGEVLSTTIEKPIYNNSNTNNITAELPSNPSVANINNYQDIKENKTSSLKNSRVLYEAGDMSFSLHKLGQESSPVLLIIGGIQGDEPGGFSAASLIATHYNITKGSVWVVPDLNLPSIHARSRGLAGDMNRKFSSISKDDPDYEGIVRIKEVLLNDSVGLILNLHDGSGFYTPTYIDRLRNPKRWGQCVIIDQERLEGSSYPKLQEMANTAVNSVNKSLLSPNHKYHLKNTETRLGDKEMEKTLTYFAICNNKPAFGIEASKEFGTAERTYYHLHVIESFMTQMGIEFERKFTLSKNGIVAALNSDITLVGYNNKIILPLDNARASINFIPFSKNEELSYKSTKLLMSILKDEKDWRVAYGNRTLTRIKPFFTEFDDSLKGVNLTFDGNKEFVSIGEIVPVKSSFSVSVPFGYRVNAIGAQKNRNGTEADVELKKSDFAQKFSIDKQGNIYRVEIYKGDAFSGMVLVNFGSNVANSNDSLTGVKGVESEFGY